MTAKIEVAARIMEHLVTCPSHGYDQNARWGNGTTESIVVDGQTYTFPGGDFDCSSGVLTAYKSAGININGATYTGNISNLLCATGKFERKPISFIASRGDLYLNDVNHVAMCKQQVPDQLMEFGINENGGIVGGRVGDQTGRESRIGSYYDYPWNCIIHYTGNEQTGKEIKQPTSDAYNLHGLFYSSHSQDVGDNEAVHDGQISGTVGHSKRIEQIRIDPDHLNLPGQLIIECSLHLANIGQVNYGVMNINKAAGTKGEERAIEAIGLKTPKNTTGKKLYFQTHQAEYGWGSAAVVTSEMTWQGSTGQNRATEAIRIWLA